MGLPLQAIFNIQLGEELAHVAIGAKKDMQAGFIPVTVLVLPGRHLAAEHVPGLEHDRHMAGVAEVFGAGETRQASSSDGDAHGTRETSGNHRGAGGLA